MHRFIIKEEWQPVDGKELEDTALQVARSSSNFLVVAGPGSGKSELLGQRASYLLETMSCKPPARILAICFKKDAARNLARRVEARCGIALASRFDCRTYDSFAKSIIDQFLACIPLTLRPTPDYVIEPNVAAAVQTALGSKPSKELTFSHVRCPLGYLVSEPDGDVEPILHEIFMRLLRMSPSVLTFPMLITLAETIFRNSRAVTNAIRITYSHVFLDEFQDTTRPQYQMLQAAFSGSPATITAVGDHRQRIMLWAGAFTDVMDHFCRDFRAARVRLTLTHRSAAGLLEVQRALARLIADDDVLNTPGASNPEGGSCEVHAFSSYRQEAVCVARQIHQWITNEGIGPRQICVLARSHVEQYCKFLVQELARLGIKARSEVKLQDVLAEPIFTLVISFVKLTQLGQWPTEYEMVTRLLLECRGLDEENAAAVAKIGRQLHGFLDILGERMASLVAAGIDADGVASVIHSIVEFVGANAFRSAHRQYLTDDSYEKAVSDLSACICDSVLSGGSWTDGIALLEGLDCVPIMTIHKSKGLEFDAIVFIGLEDGAFWNIENQEQEETSALYVALTRARRHILLTYSVIRNSGRRGQEQKEGHRLVGSFYDALKQANVPMIDRRHEAV